MLKCTGVERHEQMNRSLCQSLSVSVSAAAECLLFWSDSVTPPMLYNRKKVPKKFFKSLTETMANRQKTEVK